jgi:hypothetical protein
MKNNEYIAIPLGADELQNAADNKLQEYSDNQKNDYTLLKVKFTFGTAALVGSLISIALTDSFGLSVLAGIGSSLFAGISAKNAGDTSRSLEILTPSINEATPTEIDTANEIVNEAFKTAQFKHVTKDKTHTIAELAEKIDRISCIGSASCDDWQRYIDKTRQAEIYASTLNRLHGTDKNTLSDEKFKAAEIVHLRRDLQETAKYKKKGVFNDDIEISFSRKPVESSQTSKDFERI